MKGTEKGREGEGEFKKCISQSIYGFNIGCAVSWSDSKAFVLHHHHTTPANVVLFLLLTIKE